MTDQIDVLKHCPVCNSEFICKHPDNCWCFSVKIPVRVLNFIEKYYIGCVCENCLNKLIENTDFNDN